MELDGEYLAVSERVVVTPVGGVFTPLATTPGAVEVGSTLGFVRSNGHDTPVTSPFRGRLMSLVALEGERLRPNQRVAWLRAS